MDDNVSISSEKDGVKCLKIKFWNWDEKKYPTEHKELNSSYFLIKKSDFDKRAIAYYNIAFWFKKGSTTFTFGAATIPIKFRFEPATYSKDFSVGLVAGPKFRISHTREIYFDVVGGLNLTSVTVDSASTNGKTRKSMDLSAFTPTLGLVCEVQKYQFGVFAGWDLINNNADIGWKYNSRMWLAFGIGRSILTTDTKSSKGGESGANDSKQSRQKDNMNEKKR